MKAEPSQKLSEEADAAAALGSDLTASMETTYSEQSSSSASSASSSEQPVYFRYGDGIEITKGHKIVSEAVSTQKSLTLVYTAIFREFRFTSEVPIWLDYHGKHVVIEQVRDHSHYKTSSKTCNEAIMDK